MKQKIEGILSPYRVLDLTDEKGLLCGKLLGDLWADVIEVEKSVGDSTRKISSFYQVKMTLRIACSGLLLIPTRGILQAGDRHLTLRNKYIKAFRLFKACCEVRMGLIEVFKIAESRKWNRLVSVLDVKEKTTCDFHFQK